MKLGLGQILSRAARVFHFTPLRLPNLENWLGNFSTSFNKKNAAISEDFTDYLTVSKSGAYTDDFSVSGWVKYNTSGGNTNILRGVDVSSAFIFRINTGNIFELTLNGSTSGNKIYNGTYTFSSNTWYYVTITYTNNTVRAYYNGVEDTLVLTDNSFNGNLKSYTSLEVLKSAAGSPYTVYGDNICLHDRKLTLADNVYLYNSGTGIDYENIGNVTKPKYAALINWSSSYLDSSVGLGITSSGVGCISTWVKVPDDVSSGFGLLLKNSSNQSSVYIRSEENGSTNDNLSVTFYGATSGNCKWTNSNPPIFPEGQWVFVTVVFDVANADAELFINGVKETNFIKGTDGRVGGGRNIDKLEYRGTEALLQNTSLYDKQLVLSEHQELYNSGVGLEYSELGNITIPKYAASFDGVNDYLSSSSTDFDKSGANNFSYGAWFKVEQGEELFIIGQFASTTPATRSYSLQRSAANILVAQISDGTTLTDTPNYTLNNTDWNFASVSYNGSTLNLYLNGSLVSSVAQTNGANGANGGDLEIARRNGSIYSTGLVQNAFFYSKSLTLSEHQDLYNSGTGLEYSELTTLQKTDLTSWWSLNETTGTRVDSVIASGNDLTENGSVSFDEGTVGTQTFAQTDDLTSWWSLNETTGTRNDSHGANNLTENGTVSFDEGKVGTQSVAMISDLTAWWDMNEISGTRYDLHSTNDLTENGTVGVDTGKVQGVPNNGDYVYSWVDESSNGNDLIQATGINQPTYTGGYLLFNGIDDKLINTSMPAISGDFTMCFWAKMNNDGNRHTPLSYATSTEVANVNILFDASLTGIFLYWNGSGANSIVVGSAGDYTDGTWRHFMAIRSGSTIELFINNVSQGTSTTNTSFTTGTTLQLGATVVDNVWYLNGNITGLVITQSALTEQQRKDLYRYNQPT